MVAIPEYVVVTVEEADTLIEKDPLPVSDTVGETLLEVEAHGLDVEVTGNVVAIPEYETLFVEEKESVDEEHGERVGVAG